MRALSVMNPWAELIRIGRKTVELRTWTIAPGDLLICSGKRVDPRGAHHGLVGERGVTMCVVDVLVCREATVDDAEAACVTHEQMTAALADAAGARRTLYAWELVNVRQVNPAPVRGALGLFQAAV